MSARDFFRIVNRGTDIKGWVARVEVRWLAAHRDLVDLADAVAVLPVDGHAGLIPLVVVGVHGAEAEVPGRVQAVGRNGVHTHVVGEVVAVAVVELGFGDVGTGISAPHLPDGPHRPHLPAEQRGVQLPVGLLVLEADQRYRRVRAGLERTSLPPRDEVGAVLVPRAGRRNLQLAHHPAAGRVHTVSGRPDGHAVAWLANVPLGCGVPAGACAPASPAIIASWSSSLSSGVPAALFTGSCIACV